MKIHSIMLENFRSFKDAVTIENLADVNIFIGANNVGKSNILELLRYIEGLIRNSPIKVFSDMVFDSKTKNNIHIRICFSPSEKERKHFIGLCLKENRMFKPQEFLESSFLSKLTFDFILGNSGLVQEEVSISNVRDGDLLILRNSREGRNFTTEIGNLFNEFSKLVEIENFAPLATLKSSYSPPPEWSILNPTGTSPPAIEFQLVNKIREFIGRWRWLESVRRATPNMPLEELTRLDSSGSSLVRFLFTIQNNNPDEKKRIDEKIHEILPNIKTITARLRGGRSIVTVGEVGLTSTRDVSNISSGVTENLILVSGIENSEADSVLLIEEPELHLHAGSQRKLLDRIKKESENKQFFITTHSSIFTCCSDMIRTYLVTKNNGISSVRRIEETSELRTIKNELGHRNTDLYGYEMVVIIEGDSEKVAFSIIAEALGYDLVEKGIYLLNIQGSGKASKITDYLHYLKDSDVLVYVILDGSSDVKRKIEDWEREGLIQQDFSKVWEKEFEDCFELELLLNAMKNMAKSQGYAFDVSLENLKENMTEGKTVVRALVKILNEKNLPDLDKPALAENIALLIKEDITKTPEKRKKTPPEEVIEKIVKIVEESHLASL